MRLLLVSNTFIRPESRQTLEELGRLCTLRALVPSQGELLEGTVTVDPRDAKNYELLSLPVWGSMHPGTRWVFSRFEGAWTTFDPEVVLVAQEVWSFATLQTMVCRRLYRPGAALAIYSYESLPRPGLKGHIARPFYRAAIARATALLVGSRDTRDLFLAHGAPPDKLHIAPHVGVDPDAFCPVDPDARAARRAALGLGPGAFVIGFAGRLVREKGILDLADAVAGLARAGADVRLALIGHGPLEPELRRRLAAGQPLRLLGAVPRHELAPFYQALDLFALPSLTTPTWKEQLGMAAAEAMSCGLPVVGSSSGAIPDVIGPAGAVFPEGDVERLQATLANLHRDEGGRARLARIARERCLRFFSHASVARQTVEILEAAIHPGERRLPPAYPDA